MKQLPLNVSAPSEGVPNLAAGIAARLRDPDPLVRADFAERLVRICDRHNRPLEQIIAKEMNQAWRPPVAAPPPPKSPMGQMNWLSWCRFMLHRDLTEWEREFIASIMRRASPSFHQRRRLREILLKVYPAGCGKWGQEE